MKINTETNEGYNSVTILDTTPLGDSQTETSVLCIGNNRKVFRDTGLTSLFDEDEDRITPHLIAVCNPSPNDLRYLAQMFDDNPLIPKVFDENVIDGYYHLNDGLTIDLVLHSYYGEDITSLFKIISLKNCFVILLFNCAATSPFFGVLVDELNREALTLDNLLLKVFTFMKSDLYGHARGLKFEVEAIKEIVVVLSAEELPDLQRRIMRAFIQMSNLHCRIQPKIKLLQRLLHSEHSSTSSLLSMTSPSLLVSSPLSMAQPASRSISSITHLYLSNLLSGFEESYTTRVTNDLALKTDRLNRILRTLTVFSVFMMPPTLISGIFGMNIWYPGRVEDSVSYTPFLLVLQLMIVFAGIQYAFFKFFKLFD